MIKSLAFLLFSGLAFGQIDLTNQGALSSGVSTPVSCRVGQMFLKLGVPNGTNFYICVYTNTWISMGVGIPTFVSGQVNTVTYSPSATFDMSMNIQKMVLQGTVTSPIFINLRASAAYEFLLCQDSVGGHSLTWPANVFGAMNIGLTASKCSAQIFHSPDGINLYALGPGVINQ